MYTDAIHVITACIQMYIYELYTHTMVRCYILNGYHIQTSCVLIKVIILVVSSLYK